MGDCHHHQDDGDDSDPERNGPAPELPRGQIGAEHHVELDGHRRGACDDARNECGQCPCRCGRLRVVTGREDDVALPVLIPQLDSEDLRPAADLVSSDDLLGLPCIGCCLAECLPDRSQLIPELLLQFLFALCRDHLLEVGDLSRSRVRGCLEVALDSRLFLNGCHGFLLSRGRDHPVQLNERA